MSQFNAVFRRIGMNAQNWDRADVVIIGGGLAGLTAAATVAKHGKRAIVLERHQSVGGDARSSTHEGLSLIHI